MPDADSAVIAFVIPVRSDAECLRTCLANLEAAAAGTPHDLPGLDHGSRDREAPAQ